jgi:hypothetical protein
MSTTAAATLERPAAGRATSARDDPAAEGAGARRFARFASAAVALTSIPYLLVLWDLFNGGIDPLRTEAYDSNFYDLQARAMFAGHLWLKNGSIGIEAFVHDGHQYTYFGIFPSLLRMPFLLVTHALDGKMTAPSILLAWLVTALFTALLVWRVRVLARGAAPLGRAEATALAVLVGSVTGGSVLVYLAATPWVFDEDFAWSVAMTVASLFALLGVMERPSRRRVVLCGLLVLAASLNRAPTAYGCEIAALLVAVWFATGRGGAEQRRWRLPVAAVGLVPLLVAGLLNTAKFGSPFALPMASQVWTSINAHRQQFLVANGGKAFSFGFLPSTLFAYLRPEGLHFSSVFPFITLPTMPASALGGAFLDQTYPTVSATASMPLLFGLACWGAITAFRRRPPGGLSLARLPLVGAAAGCSGALLWGYIADRYLADFMPLLILGAAVGMVDLWRRLEGRSRRVRRGFLGVLGVVGVFGVAANVAVSTTPAPTAWTDAQALNFVDFQARISNVTGHPLNGLVVKSDQLPYYAPAGELVDVDQCSGLYLSSGYSYATVPDEQYEHFTWIPLEQGAAVVHRVTLVFNAPLLTWGRPFALFRIGHSGVVARLYTVEKNGKLDLRFDETDPHTPPPGVTPAGGLRIGISTDLFGVRVGTVYQAELVADPWLDQLSLVIGGRTVMSGPYTPGGPFALTPTDVGPGQPIVTITPVQGTVPTPLCTSLTR